MGSRNSPVPTLGSDALGDLISGRAFLEVVPERKLNMRGKGRRNTNRRNPPTGVQILHRVRPFVPINNPKPAVQDKPIRCRMNTRIQGAEPLKTYYLSFQGLVKDALKNLGFPNADTDLTNWRFYMHSLCLWGPPIEAGPIPTLMESNFITVRCQRLLKSTRTEYMWYPQMTDYGRAGAPAGVKQVYTPADQEVSMKPTTDAAFQFQQGMAGNVVVAYDISLQREPSDLTLKSSYLIPIPWQSKITPEPECQVADPGLDSTSVTPEPRS